MTLAMLMITTLLSSFHADGTRTPPPLSSWRTFYGLFDSLVTLVCCHLLSALSVLGRCSAGLTRCMPPHKQPCSGFRQASTKSLSRAK